MPSHLASTTIRRVVLVVLDGLRPDAVPRFDLVHFARLAARGATTYHAQTVTPSVTACAMASLLTGAAPERHGLQSERVCLPRPRDVLHPLPRELARYALPTSAFLGAVPLLMRGLAQKIASGLGVTEARFHGRCAADILATAQPAIDTQQRGLILMHWPDADQAGHYYGWMSPEYARAASRMDETLGRLVRMLDLDDPATLLIALADHGGGGRTLRHHDSDHPLDLTIPVVLAGGSVAAGDLGLGVNLLDVPASVLWALGVPQPASYGGQVLFHAFGALPLAA